MEHTNLLKTKRERFSKLHKTSLSKKSQPKFNKNNRSNNSKKKTLSQTTSIKRINIRLIIAGVIIFILLSIYPILNLIIIDGFMTDGKFSL